MKTDTIWVTRDSLGTHELERELTGMGRVKPEVVSWVVLEGQTGKDPIEVEVTYKEGG